MAFEQTAVVDCSIITRTFERAAAFAVTEESVFAMMTPILQTTRTQSTGIIGQIENNEALSSPQTSDQKTKDQEGGTAGLGTSNAINLKNLDKADEEDDGFLEDLKGNFFPGSTGQVEGTGNLIDAEVFGNIFNSECIPCGDRLNMLGELDLKSGLNDYLDHWKQWLINHFQNLLGMLNVFNGADRYIDLCALLKFLKDFICVPDLARMLSALMALMSQTSFEFNGIFDLIMSLVAPLTQPFLSNFVDMLQRYILMIIKPIECIIDSIQAIITKLDYNILFQNIDNLDRHVSLGRRQGPVVGTTGENLSKLPFVDVEVDLHQGPTRAFEEDFNSLNTATGGQIKRKNAEDQAEVEAAADELRAVQAAGSKVDGSDPEAVERHNEQQSAARERYRDAVEERNLSELGQINKRLEDFQTGFKSSIYTLIGFLRKAAESVEGFFQDLFDELKKIMGEYFGGSGGFIQMLTEKFVLVQMISWIAAIIKAFSSNLHCDDDEEDIKIERLIPQSQGTFVWTDDEGNVHIEEDPATIDTAIEETVRAMGIQAPGGPSQQDLDKGVEPTEQSARQKLKSLIEFTGDPVLDASIARATEALVTPVNVTFKCPLQTTVKQAEQVNTWIREINAQ